MTSPKVSLILPQVALAGGSIPIWAVVFDMTQLSLFPFETEIKRSFGAREPPCPSSMSKAILLVVLLRDDTFVDGALFHHSTTNVPEIVAPTLRIHKVGNLYILGGSIVNAHLNPLVPSHGEGSI